MPDSERPEELLARIAEVGVRLEAVERRLEALETAARGPAAEQGLDDAPEASAFRLPAENFAFVGRTLLVLAGAFAIRSLTESGTLPATPGVALGLAYALFWLVLADGAARRSRFGSAIFHTLAASAIAYPLLWENVAKFGVLSPSVAVAGIAAFAGASLAVAWRRDMPAIVWIATIGSIAASVAVALSAGSLVPSATVLLALGAVTLGTGEVKGWRGPAFVAAAAAGATIALMTPVLLFGQSPQVDRLVAPGALVGLQIALTVLYLGSPLVRALRTRGETTLAEIAVAAPAVVVGVGGAILAERAAGLGAGAIGAVACVLAAGCYAVSFVLLDRGDGGRAGFIFYTSAALVLSIAAFAMLLDGPAMALSCCAAAVAMAWVGYRRMRATLSLHAAVFLATACLTSGLLALAARGLMRSTPFSAGEISPQMGAVLAASLLFAALPVASHGRTWGRMSWLPKLLVLALLTFGASGLVVVVGTTLLSASSDGTASSAGLAVLRTATLAAAAVVLALVSKRAAVREAGWLVYPVLIAGGLKLIVEDFRVAPPGGLVLSFALLGGALIVAPLLARRSTAP